MTCRISRKKARNDHLLPILARDEFVFISRKQDDPKYESQKVTNTSLAHTHTDTTKFFSTHR